MHTISRKWKKPKPKYKSSKIMRENAMKRWSKSKKGDQTPAPTQLSNPVNVAAPSTSKQKIGFFDKNVREQSESTSESESENVINPHKYNLIHRSVWSTLFSSLLCPVCKLKTIEVFLSESHGFVKKINVKCSSCDEIIESTYSSPRLKLTKFTASTRPSFGCNRKVVDSFLDIGAGYRGVQRFGATMGMEILSQQSYYEHLLKISEENTSIKDEVLRQSCEVVRRTHEDLDPSIKEKELIDITVSFDGSWPKRGHTSLAGFAAVIDVVTGLVVDFEILSKHCHTCAVHEAEQDPSSSEFEEWLNKHVESGECEKNYSGSSGAMEVAAAEILWRRSIKKNKMRYTTMLSDGDAKTFLHLVSVNPYDGVKIEKEECLNHVGKRLNTALRQLVITEKARKVTLGGRGAGSLKDTTILRMQGYYQRAIRRNMPDVTATRREILAIIDHMRSTDARPMHSKCPKGDSSWCFFNKARASGNAPKSHSNMSCAINELVYKKVKPIFNRLSGDELLKRCTQVGTQNANESLHSVIWRKCPKDVFFSRRRYEIGITRGISEFNMGLSATLNLRTEVSNDSPVIQGQRIATAVDRKRKQQSDAQKQRTQKKAKKKTQNKKVAAKKNKDVAYKSGGY